MALQLKLTHEQSNDATILRITDDTGIYSLENITGWGTPNPRTADVVGFSTTTAGKYHLGVEITITTSDGVETEYDPIDLYTNFSDQLVFDSGMVFDITEDLLSLTALPDGVWEIKYYLTTADTEVEVAYVIISLFIDGTVEKKVAQSFLDAVFTIERGISQENWDEIKESLIKYAYLIGARSNPSLAQIGKKLNILRTLENYTIND